MHPSVSPVTAARSRPCRSAAGGCCSRIASSARSRRWLPGGVAEPWDRFERRLVLRRPRLSGVSLAMKAALGGRSAADAATFLNAIDRADLVVVNGAGIITDAFRDSALGILTTLELAARRSIPTALLGQGLGPIADPVLWQRAAEVLPLVTLIGVRESQASVPLLSSLGVNADNVAVTGDDAVELAFSALGARPAAVARGARRSASTCAWLPTPTSSWRCCPICVRR